VRWCRNFAFRYPIVGYNNDTVFHSCVWNFAEEVIKGLSRKVPENTYCLTFRCVGYTEETKRLENTVCGTMVLQYRTVLLYNNTFRILPGSRTYAILWDACSNLPGYTKQTSVFIGVESSWNVMAHGDARERKWRRNWRMGG
jgi:hypothetical protein